MTITIADVEKVRRMTNEIGSSTYDFTTISGYLYDAAEDKNAVAAEIWGEKASAIQSTMYNFSADGASYNLSEAYDHCIERVHFYSSRRTPKSSLWVKDPVEDELGIQTLVIVNDTTEELG